MARYISEFTFSGPQDALMNQISQYLFSEGYEFRQNYNGEDLFKKGKGIATGPTFIKFTDLNGAIRIEAWVKFAVVPGVYAGEMGVDGVAGCAIKIPLKNRIKYIEGMIVNFGGRQRQVQQTFQQTTNQPKQPIQQTYQQPQPQQAQPKPHSFCTNCGTKLDSGAMFCHACGTRIQR